MICYKDMTFCPFKSCKYFKECPYNRALTKMIEKKAKSTNLPISVYVEEPECYEEKK